MLLSFFCNLPGRKALRLISSLSYRKYQVVQLPQWRRFDFFIRLVCLNYTYDIFLDARQESRQEYRHFQIPVGSCIMGVSVASVQKLPYFRETPHKTATFLPFFHPLVSWISLRESLPSPNCKTQNRMFDGNLSACFSRNAFYLTWLKTDEPNVCPAHQFNGQKHQSPFQFPGLSAIR